MKKRRKRDNHEEIDLCDMLSSKERSKDYFFTNPIYKLIGGNIEVIRSEKNKGTIFRIEIPRGGFELDE